VLSVAMNFNPYADVGSNSTITFSIDNSVPPLEVNKSAFLIVL
jgi:hypothetical protein